MKTLYQIVFILFSLTTLTSCDESVGYEEEEYYSEDYGYQDGTYCAEIEYYYSKTGTRSTYTLEVEIEDNELTKIYWPNGGWLDEDHFYPESLDESGFCSFTSDKGYEYEIQITGQDCGYTDQISFQDDINSDEESLKCPRCGDEKDYDDDYCSSCESDIEDEEENTCSGCGGFQYGVYGGLCSSCEDDEW